MKQNTNRLITPERIKLLQLLLRKKGIELKPSPAHLKNI
jgi:hypothetical protein